MPDVHKKLGKQYLILIIIYGMHAPEVQIALKELSNKFGFKETFCLQAMVDYICFMNKDRTPIQVMIDNATGYLWATPEIAMEFVQWFYDGEPVPEHFTQFVTLFFANKKHQVLKDAQV
jgi:hypothetical protein